MATIGTLAYRIVMNVSNFAAGSMATRSELRALRTAFVQTADPVDRLRAVVERLHLMRDAGMDCRLFAAGLASVRREALQSIPILSAMANRVSALVVALGTLVVAFKIASDAEEFNRTMKNSLAIMEDVSEDMKRIMVNTSIKVAAETNSNYIQTAGAYKFLASAGLDAEQSLKALPIVARFAQAGMFDLEKATTLAVGSQAALGKVVKDPIQNMENLRRVTDLLSHANNIGLGSVEDFSAALANGTAASLRILNKDAEEGLAVLVAYANQMIIGEEAGTQFTIVLRDLQTKAIDNAAVFSAYGVSVFDASGKMRNFADILRDLEVLMDGLSDRDKKMALMNLGFTDKSVNSLLKIVGMSSQIKESEKSFRAMRNATENINNKQLTEWAKAMNEVNEVLDIFKAKIIIPIIDALGMAIQFVVGAFKGKYGVMLQIIANAAVYATTMVAVVGAIELVIRICRVLSLIWQTMIFQQITLQALSGPKGWVTLAAGLAAATIAYGVVSKGISDITNKTEEAGGAITDTNKQIADSSVATTKKASDARTEVTKLTEKYLKDQKALIEKYRDDAGGTINPDGLAKETSKLTTTYAKAIAAQKKIVDSENQMTQVRIEGNRVIQTRIKLTEQQAASQRLMRGPGNDPNSPESIQFQPQYKQLPKGPPTKEELQHQAKQAKIMFDAIEKSGKEYDKMVEKGKEMAKKLRTPAEVFRDTVAEINQMFDGGFINLATKMRALKEEREKLSETMEKDRGLDKTEDLKAIESGTQEAFAADFRKAADSEKEAIEREIAVLEAGLVEQKEQTGILRDMSRRSFLDDLDVISIH